MTTPETTESAEKPAKPKSFWWHILSWWFERDSDRHLDDGKGHRSRERVLGWAENPRWSSVWALFVTALVTAGMLGVTVALLKKLEPETARSVEAQLSLVFVAAGVILILVVCTLTIVFRRLLLTNEKEPMGLPRGSVRAVIALLLIMLFFIAVIFLFNSTRNSMESESLRTLKGISAARFESIPTDLIQSSRQVGDAANPTYNVKLATSENTATSDDIAKQLVTTLATLVTAVAAFYFGAGHVQSAIEAEKEGRSGNAKKDRRRGDARNRQEPPSRSPEATPSG